MEAVVVVEAAMVGSVGDFAADGWDAIFLFTGESFARVGVQVLEIEVPLADEGGVVAL